MLRFMVVFQHSMSFRGTNKTYHDPCETAAFLRWLERRTPVPAGFSVAP